MEQSFEGFGNDLTDSKTVILCDSSSVLWMPHEFIGTEATTKIFIYSEHSTATRIMLATNKWSIVFCMNGTVGSRNWSVFASMLRHMLSPILIVIAPDVNVPSTLAQHIIPIKNVTMLIYRWIAEPSNIGLPISAVFFPLAVNASNIISAHRAIFNNIHLRINEPNLVALVQETRSQGLCIVSNVFDNSSLSIGWYRLSDSESIVSSEKRIHLGQWLSAISGAILKFMESN